MAEDIKLVILNDDETYTSSEGAHYAAFRHDADDVYEAGENKELLGFADEVFRIDDLVAVARSAASYIRAENSGPQSEVADAGGELAESLVKAGLLEPAEVDEFFGRAD